MQEIEQDKHYVERFQLIPVDEQTYSYEPQQSQGQGQSQSNGGPIDASDLIKRDNHSADREQPMQEQQSVATTVYVSQSNEETDGLRYSSNPQIRYEEEAYHHTRYEYQPHPSHPSAEDIKAEMARNQHHHQQQQHQQQQHQAKVHIYEQQEGGPRTEVGLLRKFLIRWMIWFLNVGEERHFFIITSL